MPFTGRQAVQHFGEQASHAAELIRSYGVIADQCEAALGRIGVEASSAARDLARAYLPSLEPSAIARAERLAGFRGFSRRDPNAAMAHEKKVLEQTVRRIEADPTYLNREALVGRTGTLAQALAEAGDMLEPWTKECARFEGLEGFLELVNARYDTPSFAGEWWQVAYWKMWARGDAICEALGMKDFGDDVLPAYQEVAKERAFWQAKVAEAESRIRDVHALVERHDGALSRMPRLPEIYLEQAELVLAEHLDGTDLQLLEEWLLREGEDRPVLVALRRFAGLKAKASILGELKKDGLETLLHGLRERLEKYNRKAAKYGRPKHIGAGVPDADLDLSFAEKRAKLDQNKDKLARLVERVERYDAYERFPLSNEPDLWWIEIAGARPPPSLMPRLRRWYDGHPGIAPVLEGTPAESDALAVAVTHALDEGDGAYLS